MCSRYAEFRKEEIRIHEIHELTRLRRKAFRVCVCNFVDQLFSTNLGRSYESRST